MNNIQYSSEKAPIVISEYGRNVQKLIQHCKTIEDKEERQAFAESIISLMSIIVPQTHAKRDYQDKLWKHFYRIAGFDIDVTSPTGEWPEPTENILSPEPVPYPKRNNAFRHYGIQIQDLISKAVEMEDDEKREEFSLVIASFMKMAYKNWNREHYVSDKIIVEDLAALSNGKLIVKEEEDLDSLMKNIKFKKHSSGTSTFKAAPKHRKGGGNNTKYKKFKRYK